METIGLSVIIFGILIVLTRFIGAWMLRINEVISEQKTTNAILNELRKDLRKYNNQNV
jgi:hypothetical protein